MRCSRTVLSVVLVAVVACGGSTPTTPSTAPPDGVKLGPQGLSIEHHSSPVPCGVPTGVSTTLVFNNMTLSWSGSEWVATATTAAGGDVELRFRQSGTLGANGFAVAGTIKGTVMHMPELGPTIPAYTARVNFGSGATLTGIALPPRNSTVPYQAVLGTGTGAATLSDGAGLVCAGTSFSWMLVPG